MIVNELIRHNYWYRAQFSDALKFKNVPQNLHVVNLGSNSGKYGFDYTECGIKGMNWAVSPQTIAFDYKILQTFTSHISKNGHVLLTISLFSSIKDNYKAKNANDKYYHFLPTTLIPDYSKIVNVYVKLKRIFPLLFIILNPTSIIGLFRIGKSAHTLEKNPMNSNQLDTDAAKWVEGWKKEFLLDSLNAPLSDNHNQIMQENRKILKDCIDLCQKNGLKPIVVLPPISRFLLVYLTREVRQIYIYDFIKEIIAQAEIKLLDYIDNPEFSDHDLYFNSFFLNARGRKMFTKRVLKEITILTNYD